MMQRRRRLEEDVTLVASLGRRAEDLKVLAEWVQQGELSKPARRGLDEISARSSGEIKKCWRDTTPQRNHPIHRGGGTESWDGPRCAPHVPRWDEQRGFRPRWSTTFRRRTASSRTFT